MCLVSPFLAHVMPLRHSLSLLPVRVDLVDLSYRTPKPKQTPILQAIRASFEPGQLVAIMEPSGK